MDLLCPASHPYPDRGEMHLNIPPLVGEGFRTSSKKPHHKAMRLFADIAHGDKRKLYELTFMWQYGGDCRVGLDP